MTSKPMSPMSAKRPPRSRLTDFGEVAFYGFYKPKNGLFGKHLSHCGVSIGIREGFQIEAH